MIFQPHSQVGQDRFAYEVCGRKTDGTFVDIGCGDPISCNNTYALEQIGWRGLCLDRVADPQRIHLRSAKNVVADGMEADWRFLLRGMPPLIDYLSLDCDENSLGVLASLPLADYGFGVITIEHDRYRLGNEQADRERELLSHSGYVLICKDVKWEGNPFEDWWTSAFSKYTGLASRFRCEGVNGLDIVAGL